MAYMGLLRKPFPYMPRALVHLHNSSGLFTHSVPYWLQYHVQLQFEPDGPWIPFDTGREFQMLSFGYRTRLNRFFEIFRGPSGHRARAELAAWVRERYGERFPGRPLPAAVRFLIAQNALKETGFEGPWRDKPLEAFSPDEIHVYSIHLFPSQ